MTDTTSARFIPGIYNYCDRWCERCRFVDRCYSHSSRLAFEAALATGETGSTSGPALVADEPPDEVASNAGIRPWVEALSLANQEPDAAEMARFLAEHQRLQQRAEADPLVRDTKTYLRDTVHLMKALATVRQTGTDPVVDTALEVLSAQAWPIASKTYRAISGQLDPNRDTDAEDPLGIQTDANGSAKVVRLLIAESVSAWEVLTSVGHACGDGIPAGMLRRLQDLDLRIAARFPRAMQFVRPGFDSVPMD